MHALVFVEITGACADNRRLPLCPIDMNSVSSQICAALNDIHISNEISSTCTAISIQALDRIGLLHDLFLATDRLGLATVHARICTEKGAAMDTIYVTWPDGSKVIDEEKHNEIKQALNDIIH